ncbi:NfeD family protein [Clostridium sediminicola]|uniref:NfeD family protein n=1 Tax=Clostridium sediminicola TaxID=3114879 RepID=UPI0031F20797
MFWFQLFLWIVVATVALVVDAITSSFFFIWFTVGGIVAIIQVLLGVAFSTQIITFIAVSLACIAVGYPIVKRTIKKTVPFTPTMEQSYLGRTFVAKKKIVQKASIKFDGIYWTVRNTGDTIEIGDEVKITGIEGNKLVVEKK